MSVPELGKVAFNAGPCGRAYRAVKGPAKEGLSTPVLTLVDRDGMLPTKGLKPGKAGMTMQTTTTWVAMVVHALHANWLDMRLALRRRYPSSTPPRKLRSG